MFIKTLRVTKEARFDIDTPEWASGTVTTASIYRPCVTEDVLINTDHIASIWAATYKNGMCPDTPAKRDARDCWLNDCEGSKVILVTSTAFVVTATVRELEAAIGARHLVDVV